MKRGINWLDLGRIDYEEAFIIHEKIVANCVDTGSGDTLLFQENNPIITLGRNFHEENLLYSIEELKKMGVGVANVSRGGDVTWHGHGQLVVSPILHFSEYVSNAHTFLRCLEQVIINVLKTYLITGKRVKGLSGVWVENNLGNEKKIAAMGIAIVKGISFHGISINVNPKLDEYHTIVPCGIINKGVTSMEECGITPSLEEVRDRFIVEFDKMFATRTIKKDKEKLNEV